jgi:L-amino acid N-acyltransferase YncA
VIACSATAHRIGRALLTERIEAAGDLGRQTVVASIETDDHSGLALQSRLDEVVLNRGHVTLWLDLTLARPFGEP